MCVEVINEQIDVSEFDEETKTIWSVFSTLLEEIKSTKERSLVHDLNSLADRMYEKARMKYGLEVVHIVQVPASPATLKVVKDVFQ